MVQDYDPDIGERYRHAWTKFFQPSNSNCLIASHDLKMVGFVTYVVHDYLWTEEPVCYMSDLYVKPEDRKNGYGRAMVLELAAISKALGHARIYWVTEKNNWARRLYDSLAESDWVRYHINLIDSV